MSTRRSASTTGCNACTSSASTPRSSSSYTTPRRLEAAADPAGRRARIPRATAADADRSGNRREPGAATAARHPPIPRDARAPDAPEGPRDRRCRTLAGRAVRAHDRRRSHRTSSASSSRPNCSTRCSSTAGSCRRKPASTSASAKRSTSYVRDVLTPLPSELRPADAAWDPEWDADGWAAEGWITEEIEQQK